MEKNQIYKANAFLQENDLFNAQEVYKFLSKVLFFGTLIGLISIVQFIGFNNEPRNILNWILSVVGNFLFGSFVFVIEKKYVKAIIFGALTLCIFFIRKYVPEMLLLSNVIVYLMGQGLLLIFFFIHGWTNQGIKTGFFAIIGFIIASLINGLIIEGASLLGDALNIKYFFLISNIFYAALTWYFVLVFESINYKENHKKIFKRLFEISHRLDRKNYVISYIYSIIPSFLIGYALGLSSKDTIVLLIFVIPVLFTSIIGLIQAVKRLHDINKKGWWLFVPIWNIYLLFLKKGDNKVNKYGLPLNK